MIFGFDKNDGSEVDIGDGEWLVVELIGSTIPFSAGFVPSSFVFVHYLLLISNNANRLSPSLPPPGVYALGTVLCKSCKRPKNTQESRGHIFCTCHKRQVCTCLEPDFIKLFIHQLLTSFSLQ